MSIEIRPARPEEMAEFSRVVSFALALDPHAIDGLQPEWTLCAFEDGQLATCYAAWPFTMRLDGAPLPVAAVTTVGTHPLMRRRGNLRTIMQTDFERLHETGDASIAILYASLAAIYQRYGYAIVSTHHAYRVEPRYLAFAQPFDPPGRLREVAPSESGLLNDIFRRFREPRNGYLHRSRAMWEIGALEPPHGGDKLAIVVYEEEGEPLGYLIYTDGIGNYARPNLQHQLRIRDLAWLTPSAYRALWSHLARFDLVNEIVYEAVAPDDPLPHLLLEPRMLRATARDGLLGRVVDVERALPVRPYHADGTVVLEIQDEMCPWNAGKWRFDATGSQGTIARSDAAADLTMPVSTLAMLLFGQLSATEASRMGRLDAHDRRALDRVDAMFRTAYRPFCPDHF